MKYHLTTLGLLCLFLIIRTHLKANPIDLATAQIVGKNFILSKNIPTEGFHLAETKTIDGQTLYYIFNTGSKGFVIVGADDNAIPILGYSGLLSSGITGLVCPEYSVNPFPALFERVVNC